MFRDEARILVEAGHGGHGCVSMRRERYVPKGGPDGGSGGRGGHVILRAESQESTLLDLVRHPHQRAGNGRPGEGGNRHGADGRDLLVRVPVGTVIRDEETGLALKDLAHAGQEVIVARGGRGGRGNASFKSATRQTPRCAEEGALGERRTLRLELKLIADVGLVGLPNAGKSTLVAKVSAARPRIADYPFTTLRPHPGIVERPGYRRFVMMDIPGLISGASRGQGLGHRFLRHVERTRVLVHMVDLAGGVAGDPVEELQALLLELEAFGRGLTQKPRLLVYSRADLVPDPEAKAEQLNTRLKVSGYPISAVTGLNLERLLEDCWKALQRD